MVGDDQGRRPYTNQWVALPRGRAEELPDGVTSVMLGQQVREDSEPVPGGIWPSKATEPSVKGVVLGEDNEPGGGFPLRTVDGDPTCVEYEVLACNREIDEFLRYDIDQFIIQTLDADPPAAETSDPEPPAVAS